MDTRILLEDFCGRDGQNEPKVMVGAYLQTINEKDNVRKDISSCSVYKPVVDIKPTNGFIQIDLMFQTETDSDLFKIWNMLNRFTSIQGEEAFSEEENKEATIFTLDLLPFENKGDSLHYVVAANPFIHCLTAENPRQPVACIRLLFFPENVGFYEAENADFTDLEVEISGEMKKRDNMARKAEQEADEKKKRLQHMEEIRKKYKE